MTEKKTGISRDLIIHPGETISDVLEERGITQSELASMTGVSDAYVSNVISGKKGISTNFAMQLEYALDVPISFWLNLQANYEAELMEASAKETITEEEKKARESLKDVVKYLRKIGAIPERESKDDSILSLRKALHVSNLINLKETIPTGAFRISPNVKIDSYVLGAWVQLCRLSDNYQAIHTKFKKENVDDLIYELKRIMCQAHEDIQKELNAVMQKYGIAFSIVMNFKGAPVQGYIAKLENGIYQMSLTIRGAFADIFWFSLFHELGHIVNGDIGKNTSIKFLDYCNYEDDANQENAADCFARDMLLPPDSYKAFLEKSDFTIEAITEYAKSQNVMPYIVIGRLQKEKFISYATHSEYKMKYKWSE